MDEARRRRARSCTLAVLCGLGVLLAAARSQAHWCGNIYTAPSRLVVKPQQQTLSISSTPTPLRVYVQNNFPFPAFGMEMRGNAGAGITTAVTPASQNVLPGQNVAFVVNVSTSGAAQQVQVSALNLQVRFRPPNNFPYLNGATPLWQGDASCMVTQSPPQAQLITGATNSFNTSFPYCYVANQAHALNAVKLSDLYPTATLGAGAPYFNRTGIQQAINWFGYRFCYDTNGIWRCGSNDCPSAACSDLTQTAWTDGSLWAQHGMRAGVDIAVRRATLGSNLQPARDAATNALKLGGTNNVRYKCLAAVVGAYLWQGVSATSFTTVLADTVNTVPQGCRNAALRILQGGAAASCAALTTYYEKAACAAAEGIQGNDAPVASILLPNAGDGFTPAATNGLEGHFYSYLLYVVAHARRAASGAVTFYPDAGASSCSGPADCNDSNVCTSDSCSAGACVNAPIAGCCTTSAQCDDANACTSDTCNTTSHTCASTPISGCCTLSSQCNDNNVCTTDTCNTTTHTCQTAPISGCCTLSTQCNDGNSCTTDTCNTTTHACTFTPTAGCCTGNAQCADSDPCTTDTCNTATGICSNVKQAGCCWLDTDCNDSSVCTTDTCNTTSHACQHAPVSGCCTTSSQCNDNNPCTADTCDTAKNACQFSTVTGCCNDAGQCNDGSACTADTCDTTTHACKHAPIAGCCSGNADCTDNDPCTVDTCDTATKTCSGEKKPGCCAYDTDCDDKNACTLDKCETAQSSCGHTPIACGSDAGPSTERGPDLPPGPGPSDGCGCAVGMAPAAGPAAGILLLVALVFGRPRRRRR